MSLSSSLIAEFQQEHLKEHGYAISAKDAEDELCKLAELVRLTSPTDGGGDGEENGTDGN